MGIQSFNLDYSSWLILIAILLGIAYASIMYSTSAPWNRSMNWLLASLRSLLVASIIVLLLGPVLNSIINEEEKPIVVLAVDNSKSINFVEDSSYLLSLQNRLSAYGDRLESSGWSPVVYTLGGKKTDNELTFDGEKSNLAKFIREIHKDFEGQNLASMLLISDGIFNQGLSPHLLPMSTPISTLGLGDTTQLLDLSIADVRFNKIAFEGNVFPIEVDIKNIGLSSAQHSISIIQNGRVLASKSLEFDTNKSFMTERFEIEASETGKQSLRIVLDEHSEEYTNENNRQTIFIDIIEGKEKILIVSGVTHPDIKAIKQAIEVNEHFEVEIAEGGEQAGDYDLIIFYQYPALGSTRRDFNYLIEDENSAKLFVLGLGTNINGLTRSGVLTGRLMNRQGDFVTGNLSENFKGFEFSEELGAWFSEKPPLTVPYASISLDASDQIIIYQKVGPVVTEKPLLFYRNEEPKTGFWFGENLWRWRLDEYRSSGRHQFFDEMIGKTVQFLASRPDSRQFKVYPVQETFDIGDEVSLKIEMYNELFEPIYGEEVTLNLQKAGEGARQNYTLTTALGNDHFNLDGLEEGLYNYSASTNINNQDITINGQFIIENINLEALDLTADHRVLRMLSDKSGGNFYSKENFEKYISDLELQESPSVIHSRLKESSLLSFYWVFLGLLLLASTEWFLRKFFGSY